MTLSAYRNDDGNIAITTNSGADSFKGTIDKGFVSVVVVESTSHLKTFAENLNRLLDEEA